MMRLSLRLLGINAAVTNNIVTTPEFSLRIVAECTPVLGIFIYAAFIIIQRATITLRVQWILLGACILVAVNLFRLLITFRISMYKPDLFNIVHLYFGQLMMSSCVIAMCVGWSQRNQILSKRDSLAFFILRFGLIFSLLFLPWLYLQSAYIDFLNEIAAFGFRLFGYIAGMNVRPGVVVSAAFDVIFFSSLMLATTALKRTDRIKWLIFGFFAISLTHIIMQACLLGNYLKPQHMWAVVFGIAGITHWVLPILMWVIALYGGQLFGRGQSVIPICGQTDEKTVQQVLQRPATKRRRKNTQNQNSR
jgi:exosortase/archaeosortase family protein